MVLQVVGHNLLVKGKNPNHLEEVSYIQFYFLFHFFLGGKYYVVPSGTVVTGILHMRPGKHDLHFLVGVELLPHAFVNIPDEKMNIGVFLFIFVIYFVFIIIILFLLYNSYNIYLFLVL
jgi:hypothetical protein